MKRRVLLIGKGLNFVLDIDAFNMINSNHEGRLLSRRFAYRIYSIFLPIIARPGPAVSGEHRPRRVAG